MTHLENQKEAKKATIPMQLRYAEPEGESKLEMREPKSLWFASKEKREQAIRCSNFINQMKWRTDQHEEDEIPRLDLFLLYSRHGRNEEEANSKFEESF